MSIDVPAIEATATVLVVDDEPMLSDLYAEWVTEKWQCETVNAGSDAVETMDDSFDVVLLDRQMPGMAGEETATRIRESTASVQVMMVSGVEPDVEIADLPIDDYVQKPVDRPTLQSKIEGLLLRRMYHETIEQFFVCAAKLTALEEAKPVSELAGNERYIELKATADELRQSADATLGRTSRPVSAFNVAELDD